MGKNGQQRGHSRAAAWTAARAVEWYGAPELARKWWLWEEREMGHIASFRDAVTLCATGRLLRERAAEGWGVEPLRTARAEPLAGLL